MLVSCPLNPQLLIVVYQVTGLTPVVTYRYNTTIMPAIIPLQQEIVYGPICSRRLGNSLGINLLPNTHKVCSSNCVYCQYGWTEPKATGESIKRAAQILTEVNESFEKHANGQTPIHCITLAGNGEPTLHPDLEEVIIGTKRLRDEFFPKAEVGILSDSTQVARPKIREALSFLDARYMKFDAADEQMWRLINKPFGNVTFQSMIEGLKLLPDIILQSMFLQGSYDNTTDTHIAKWVEIVGSLKPKSVQVYTVDRGTAAEGITEVSLEDLNKIADRLTKVTGISTDVFD